MRSPKSSSAERVTEPQLNTLDRARWSIEVIDPESSASLWSSAPDTRLATASVGKVLLLIEVATQFESGELAPAELLERCDADAALDSGIWQHLSTDRLPVVDIAAMIGLASDNLATNVLLRRIGLDRVTATSVRLGLLDTRLHDRVRDVRAGDHPPFLSTGTAAELAGLFAGLARGEIGSAPISRLVLDWLALGMDLSMVGSGLGMDPLAHFTPDRGLRISHKTGTNSTVRADVGVISGPGGTRAYAALCNCPPGQFETGLRDDVLADMRTLGHWITAQLS
jgi:beta-lactamase class A